MSLDIRDASRYYDSVTRRNGHARCTRPRHHRNAPAAQARPAGKVFVRGDDGSGAREEVQGRPEAGGPAGPALHHPGSRQPGARRRDPGRAAQGSSRRRCQGDS
ncbi:MAG: hypothetical protein [Inoviridae sp.]|nr:MAG: hypothetical protein [Inoviridae sp.]